jgi:hypothetical protein
MNPSMLSGLVVGEKRFTGLPFLSITNLVKFHLMRLPNIPPRLAFRYLKMG